MRKEYRINELESYQDEISIKLSDRFKYERRSQDKYYKPSKPTVLAFALALELPLDQMQEMLVKAGFSLSHSNKFDIIVEFFVKRGNYNVYEINEALFAFDQSLIGA